MEEKKLSIQSSIVWNSVGSIFYLGCQWLITVLVVRLSGVDEAGVLSLAMSVCNIWYCLSVYGMRNFQISDTENKYQQELMWRADGSPVAPPLWAAFCIRWRYRMIRAKIGYLIIFCI